VILNIIAIVLSGAALATSTYIALQHRELQKAANFIPAYMQLIKEFRTMEFNDNYRYVTTQLQAEHDPVGLGYWILGLTCGLRCSVIML
jgi:hypothetical protein